MDLTDIILPLAKVLHHLSLRRSCDAVFAILVAFWIATRHILYLAICWSIYAHVNSNTMAYGTYSTVTGAMLTSEVDSVVLNNIFQPFVSPSAGMVSFNAEIRWVFFGLLLALQGITIVWFVMIVRVIVRVFRGEGATDARSDDEEEE